MAGHSKFANIKHRKGAQDAKRAKVFTRLIREITIAARAGDDIQGNPRLRSAIIAAKAANMPKDRIDNAIKKGSASNEGDNYESFKYEAYGPAGTAFIVTSVTDNRNRSASSIRTIFNKNGGNLAETGSVSFMFDHLGVIKYSAANILENEIFELAVEAGAQTVESNEIGHVILTNVSDFAKVRDILIEKYDNPTELGLQWIAKNKVAIDEDKQESFIRLIDLLDEDDDVEHVYHNADIILS
jgi:YebC/PmpR family DNA-binding regulatory protein